MYEPKIYSFIRDFLIRIVAVLNLDATSLSICPFCASIVKNERKKNIWLQLPRVSKCTENGSLHERRVKP